MNPPAPSSEPAHARQSLDLAQWQVNQRPQHFVEGRSLGSISMYEFSQPPGSFPDPAANAYLLQLNRRTTRGRVAFGGQRMDGCFLAGEMILAPTHTWCDYVLDDPSHAIAVPISLDLAHSVAVDWGLPKRSDLGVLHTLRLVSDEIQQLLLALWEAGKAKDSAAALLGEQLAISLTTGLLRLSAQPATARRRRHALAPSRLRQVFAYVEDHLTEGVSLQVMADIAQVSTNHFLRSFKQDIGETPYQYVCRRRVERALDLLRLTDRPIAEIALACGYASHQHLCAAMARWRNCSPRNFQRH